MGWTFTHRPKGETSKAFFQREFGDRVLDVASPSPSETYFAYRLDNGEVIAIACLTSWRRGDYYNFGYKDMDETMGPCICNCPQRILDLLTPIDNEWANAWRKRAYDNLAQRKARPCLQIGDNVQFAEPITFTNGRTCDTLTIISTKPLRFSDGYTRYKVSRSNLKGIRVLA